MRFSVIMPVYNENRCALDVIKRVLKMDMIDELIVVDDGSTDGTKELLERAEFGSKVRIIFHEKNLGKGAAIRTGLKEARGDIIAIQDADFEYNPLEFKVLIKAIIDGKASVVYGSRFMKEESRSGFTFLYRIGNSLLTYVTNLLYRSNLTDMETAYKVFKADIIKSIELTANDFSFEPEVTAKLLKRGIKIYEMPISYFGRSRKEGKKIRWFHGFGALWTLVKFRFID